ncbi:MAG: hypothetical protein P8O86_05645 [Actinomycetota bacterium]|nr:hypothetical protein [Actinomycetota bacterium]MDG2119851.1 hypothetical protein [Actinomycetota bacterium]
MRVSDEYIVAAKRAGNKTSSDKVFKETGRYWSGGFWLIDSDYALVYILDDGVVVGVEQRKDLSEWGRLDFGYEASDSMWSEILLLADPAAASLSIAFRSEISRIGNRDAFWRYAPSAGRILKLLSTELKNA